MSFETPQSGMLYFFYDVQSQPWGYDPKDRDRWRVLFAKTPDDAKRQAPPELSKEDVFKECLLTPSLELTVLDWAEDRLQELEPNEALRTTYEECLDRWYGKTPWHRLLGHPQIIQNPMQFECQMVYHGIYDSGMSHPKFSELEAGISDWQLLLQIDSDEKAQMCWGDGGRLYYWIRKQDLAKCVFDDVWLVLQCY